MFVELPIEFLRPLSNLEVQEKQTATFECEINKPKQEATWYQAGTKITPEMERIHPESDGKLFRLVIDSCQLDDTHKYKCSFKNAQTSAKLNVLGKNPVKKLKLYPGRWNVKQIGTIWDTIN